MKARQQGDVRFVPSVIPEDAKKISTRIVAEGEVTGHKHEVCGVAVEMYEYEGTLFVRCMDEAVVTHQEHKEITLPKGDWQVKRVQEKDMLEGFVRQVQD